MTAPHDTLTGPQLIALRVLDHDRWSAIVRQALAATRSRRQAAVALDVSASVVARWIDQEPALVEGVELRGSGRPLGGKLSKEPA